MWGTTRSYIANAVRGVSQGFRKELELHGVGLRAQVVDRAPGRSELVMKLGYCHDSVFAVPPHLSVSTPTPTTVVVFGTDRQQVGLAAARIRDLRRPDAYKGKGVRYAAEVLRLKKVRSRNEVCRAAALGSSPTFPQCISRARRAKPLTEFQIPTCTEAYSTAVGAWRVS